MLRTALKRIEPSNVRFVSSGMNAFARHRYVLVLFALAAIVIFGAAIRFYQLAAAGFYDEAASWTFARLPWESFWRVMWAYEGNMVFYYVLLRGWLYFGDSEFVLRTFSVLFGVASIPALYLLGSRLFSRRAGLTAAVLLSVHALHVQFSQQARSYSLVVLLVILSCYFFVRAVETPGRKLFWLAYIVFSSLAFYSQFFSALVLAAQWLSLGGGRIRRIGAPTLAGIAFVLALLWVPGIAFALLHQRGQLQWIPPLSWDLIQDFAWVFVGYGSGLLIALYAGLCLFSIAWPGYDLWYFRLTAAWLFVPIAATIGLSMFKPLLVPRLLLICVPALTLLAALGIVELARHASPWRWLSPLILAGLIALSLRGDLRYFSYAAPAGKNFRAATRYVLDRTRPNDGAFFFTAATHLSFNYYAHRELEEGHASHKPAVVFPAFGNAPTGAQPTPTRAQTEAAVANRRRIWLVLNASSIELLRGREWAAQEILATLEEKFRLQDRRNFAGSPNLIVSLYVRRQN